jgi:general secretion pathway protein D
MKQGTGMKSQITVFVTAALALLANFPVYAQFTGFESGTETSAASTEASANSYGPGIGGDVVVQIDPETGSLIVIADEETNEQVRKVVENLDRPVPQVLIKVVFLEVTHTKDLDLGVEASFNYKGGDHEDMIQTIFGLSAITRGAFATVIEEDFSATLRALSGVAKLEVLSKPSVLTRNNQAATITVGEEVPFVRNTRVTSDGQTINTVEYEDIGIILTVTPFINPDGLVEMDLYTEISTITGDTVPISDTVDAAVFAKRSAETMVVAPDGKTVVIGGLMEDNLTEATSKVPILGDIPILGFPFRRVTKTKAKTELLIFLTPYVVRTESELREMSLSEKNRTELVPEVFSDEKMDKYIDNLGD